MKANFRHLRAFVAVAENLNFTRAASEVCITQSALSALIRQLEIDVGVRLFQRNTRIVELTPIGHEFYITTKKILSDFTNAIEDVQSYASLSKGHVSVAALPTICVSALPAIAKIFKEKNPEISLKILDIPGNEMSAVLKAKEVDMALGYSGAEKEVDSKLLLKDKLIVLCKKDFLGNESKVITWRQLKDTPIIAMAQGTTIRSLILHASIAKKLHLNIILEPQLLSSAIAYAESGLGVAILPSSIASIHLPESLTQIDLIAPDVYRDISLMTLSKYSLSPAAQAFYDAVIEHNF